MLKTIIHFFYVLILKFVVFNEDRPFVKRKRQAKDPSMATILYFGRK